MRRLVSNFTGDCLTTADNPGGNSVWLSPCGGDRSGQFWTADNSRIQNQNANFLWAEDAGLLQSGSIIVDKWTGTHD